jgi:alpha-D-ribose 1-methylphosphonate 5-triphosphate synthase subunit PhnL
VGECCGLLYRTAKLCMFELKKDMTSIILEEGILLELKDKNAALLNIKHDDEIVRKCCERILKKK